MAKRGRPSGRKNTGWTPRAVEVAETDATDETLVGRPLVDDDPGGDKPRPVFTISPKFGRATLPVDEDGRIDPDRLTPDAKARVAALLSDPRLSEKLGQRVGPVEVDAITIGLLFYALGSAQTSIAIATGHTVESSKEMAYTTDEITTGTPLIQQLLAKYPTVWAQYQEELAVAGFFLGVLTFKIAKLEKVEKGPRKGAPVPLRDAAAVQ